MRCVALHDVTPWHHGLPDLACVFKVDLDSQIPAIDAVNLEADTKKCIRNPSMIPFLINFAQDFLWWILCFHRPTKYI